MYAKVFEQILDSSIARDCGMRRMFQDMLLLANSDGVVDMTFFAIAQRLVLPEDEVILQIGKLCNPDPLSRTPDEDGRRLIQLDPHRNWGWLIVNYQKYRDMKCENDRKRQVREAVRRHRASKQSVSVVIDCNQKDYSNQSVIKCNPKEKEKEKEKEEGIKTTLVAKLKKIVVVELPTCLNTDAFKTAWSEWNAYRKERRIAPYKPIGEKKQFKKLAEIGELRSIAAIEFSIRQNYQGIYEEKENGNRSNFNGKSAVYNSASTAAEVRAATSRTITAEAFLAERNGSGHKPNSEIPI